MRGAPALVVAMTLATGSPAQGRTTVHHATGSFAVTITPEAQTPAPAGGVATSRMDIDKTFSGGMVGTATGTMLAAGTPAAGQAAAYVAVDQFHGTVDGKAGGFTLLHRGTITKAGVAELSVMIAPDSGTGALTGIAGTFAIDQRDGQHVYDLAYTLPE